MARNINLANEIITTRVAMALLPAFTSAYSLAEGSCRNLYARILNHKLPTRATLFHKSKS